MSAISQMSEKILSFHIVPGEPIPRSIVEDILDFNIMLEPDPMDMHGQEKYEVNVLVWKETLKHGEKIIHAYGQQLRPPNLARLQEEFYSFTNSLKYRRSALTISVARTTLGEGFEGLHGWLS